MLRLMMNAGIGLGGVNRFSLHCRLAKFRGLMFHAKYSAVIGWEVSKTLKFRLGSYKSGILTTNHSAVFVNYSG